MVKFSNLKGIFNGKSGRLEIVSVLDDEIEAGYDPPGDDAVDSVEVSPEIDAEAQAASVAAKDGKSPPPEPPQVAASSSLPEVSDVPITEPEPAEPAVAKPAARRRG